MLDSSDSLTDSQLLRYGRHVILSQVGEAGQVRLLRAKVLMVGAGGLGSACLPYLVAAGVGEVGIVDHDSVDIGNLQRQILHSSYDVGRPKIDSAAETLQAINPECKVQTYQQRLTSESADEMVRTYDLVIDGSDNFAARYALGDACALARKPLVSAAVVRMEGQITLFKPYEPDGACYRCLYPSPPDETAVPRCDSVGILGPMAGILGTLQALSAIKELLALGEGLFGRLLLVDGFDMRFYEVRLHKSTDCEFCRSLT